MHRRSAPLALPLLAALALAAAGCALWGSPFPVPPAPDLDPAPIASDVAWLADDAREGRGVGTPGLAEAADYLARSFAAAGFAPGAPDGGYLQHFEMPVSIEIDRAALAVNGESFARGRDFEAFANSDSGEVEAEVVFVGYGISDAEAKYDDYAGTDVEGKIVLVLDYRPELEALEDPGRGHRHTRAFKNINARDRGAAAVLLTPSITGTEELAGGAGDEFPSPTDTSSKILALGLSRDAAERILAVGGGPSLAELQAEIERGERPQSRPLGVRARVAVNIVRERGEVANVIGVLPGSDPILRDQAVVVGAHYDHLGRGQFGTLAPDRRGEIHNGADDNASGTAGLLALARAFGQAPPPRRTLVLVAFTGEEVGLAGSDHYVRQPALPLSETTAMINLDMIGRLRERSLTVFGVETSKAWTPLLRKADDDLELELNLVRDGVGPSDQTPFAVRSVPVLFFFTGTHEGYHTPEDDVVDAVGAAEVLRLVYRVTRSLLDADRRPLFSQEAVRARGRIRGPTRGYGAYLGTVPSFGGPPVRGARIQAVRLGSPAERAGLRGGDVIVEFDGASVANLEEFAALLFRSRPGRKVEIVVERDGERVTTIATLGTRR